MFCARKSFFSFVLAVAAFGGLTGCPLHYSDAPVELLVSPTALNFGSNTVTRTIEVTKNSTAREMSPLSVTSLDPWILPQSCTNGDTGCVSRGPIDPITIRIKVDRSRMSLGANYGAIMLESAGAVAKTVEVEANALLVPNFTADNRSPQPGEMVQFTDLTQSADGPVISREWDFGDGAKSTASNPAHVFTQERAYQVSLTVTTANRTETAVKSDYILVGGQGPAADFAGTPLNLFEGETVKFTDRSSSGIGQIKSWAWTFGDGGTSSSPSPYHTYAQSGRYAVSLTVANEYGSSTETKDGYVFVQKKVAPTASFVTGPLYVNQYIQFTDTSNPGSSPIKSRRWNFGDPGGLLNISTQTNPKYMYKAPGTYHVTLTVSSEHGTSTAERDLEVVYAPLTADFTVSRERALVNDEIVFTDTSLFGSLPITGWTWDFGDGTISYGKRPAHAYTRPGAYTVKLTVETEVDSSTATRQGLINVFERRAIDDFMRRPDFSYSYEHRRTINNYGVTGHIILMTSQQWRSAEEVDLPLWKHWVTLLVPPVVRNSTALLMVSGGGNSSAQAGEPVPASIDPVLAEVAKDTGSVVVVLNQVPSERLVFADEFDPRYITRGRSEDEIIAYTYYRFFETYNEGNPDTTWPLLLAMAKSAVRAMDTVQDFMKKQPSPVDVKDFVVTGASKRGWTTWLTGVYDHRVRAIAPIVIDVLNMDVQMDHHRTVYGFYSPAIEDYVDLFIFEHFNKEDGQALLKIVDPYEYRERLIMPKLILNSTGDQFFLPDSAQFYFHDLLGQKNLYYAPNTNHSMGGYEETIAALAPWYNAVVQERELPVISWVADNSRMIIRTETEPQEVLLWTATSPDRIFIYDDRYIQDPAYWTARPLEPSGVNRYIAEPTKSDTEWTGFFVQFKFESGMIAGGVPAPYVFCTEIRVAPPNQPIPPKVDFYADKQQADIHQDIHFTDQTAAGTANVSVWEWEFGDGATSSLRDPVHAYAAAGTYSVTLTARSLVGEDSMTRTGYITILEPTGTQVVPDVVGLTREEAEAAITASGFVVDQWIGEPSETVPEGVVMEQDPPAGTELLVGSSVDLVVSTGSSTTQCTVPDIVGMAQADAETAILGAGLTVGNVDTQPSAIVPVGHVISQNPPAGESRPQNSPVNFVISTGVTPDVCIVPDLINMPRADAIAAIDAALLVLGTENELASVTVPQGSVMMQSPAAGTEVASGTEVNITISLGPQYTELDEYIQDLQLQALEYTQADYVPMTSADVYVLNMKSQDWLTINEVNRPEWRHWLSVVVPHEVKSTTALLMVAGGRYLIEPPNPHSNMPNWWYPDDEMPYLKNIATLTNSVVALLPQVPCEPLMFWDEQASGEPEKWRTEDEIIAYSYDKYLTTSDPKWPALFPMVGSAVRAMDTIQDFYQTSYVEDFVVTGASKRGWTTWLTGAVDQRVCGIVPMVIDVLNMDVQMDHHYKAYNGMVPPLYLQGGYSDEVHDYVDMNIFERFSTPEGQALLRLVDPYEYRNRLYMPKLIMNATGDQFFLPDSSQFYINDMPGETALRYLPNADHGLEYDPQSTLDAVSSIATFFQAQLMGGKLPRYPWEFVGDNTISVTPLTTPQSAKVWFASNPFERDFRLKTLGPVWESQTLYRDNKGKYTATVPMPSAGWTGFFIELQYTSPILGVPYVFTTPVRVIPDVPGLGPYPDQLYRYDLEPHMSLQPGRVDFPAGKTTEEVSITNLGEFGTCRGLRWYLDSASVPEWLTVSAYSGEIATCGGSFPIYLDANSGVMDPAVNPANPVPYTATLRFTTNGFQGDVYLPVSVMPGEPGMVTGAPVDFDFLTEEGMIRCLNKELIISNYGTCKASWMINTDLLPKWLICDGPSSGTVAGGGFVAVNLRANRTVQLPAWYDFKIPIISYTSVPGTLATTTAQVRMQVPPPELAYLKFIDSPHHPLPPDPDPLKLDFGASLTQASWRFYSAKWCDVKWSVSDPPEGSGFTIDMADSDDVLYTSNGGGGAEEAWALDPTNPAPHGYQYKTLYFTLDRSVYDPEENYEETITVTITDRDDKHSQSATIRLVFAVSYSE